MERSIGIGITVNLALEKPEVFPTTIPKRNTNGLKILNLSFAEFAKESSYALSPLIALNFPSLLARQSFRIQHQN